jgi:glycosyltransferase involved in cell wall biosynthesis
MGTDTALRANRGSLSTKQKAALELSDFRPMPNLPFVSVIMPVRNEGAFISRSLGAVLAQNYPSDRMEVIVADGMSTDDTRDIVIEISRRYPSVMLLDNTRRIASTGLNGGVREASGDIIIRVDGHCEIASDYVRQCVALLLENKADCVGGPLETIGETYVAGAIAAAMSSHFGVGGSAFRVGTSDPKCVDTVPFPAYKRETLQRVGEFDEELVRNQDDEYNYRLRGLGGRILLSPDIRSRYYSRTGLANLWKQYFEYGFWKVRVLQKHGRQMRPRQFAPALLVLSLLIGLLLSPWSQIAALSLGAILVAYAIAAVWASLAAAHKRGWLLLPLLPLVFPSLHVAYGCGFLVGLLWFWNRWRDTKNKLTGQPAINNGRLREQLIEKP